MTLYDTFIHQVTSGELLSNEKVVQAVDRHLNDLKRKDFPYYFDRDEADRAIAFIKLLRHTKGEWANRQFDLQPFQAFIVASIFGWKRKDNDRRRFSKAYVEMARKNGKSELAAAIALYCFILDGEWSSEIYTCATQYKQAKIVFDLAKSMARKLKAEYSSFASLIEIWESNMNIQSTESKFEPLPDNPDKYDGLNPSCAIMDELHAHKSSELYKVIETGMGARPQPLIFSITTAGFNKQSFCYAFRGVCVNVLKGTMEDETLFCIIFTLDEGDDWKDETNYIKANPNIGNAPYWHYMKTKLRSAINEGAVAEVEFKTKNLNIWTATGSTWIKDETYLSIVGDYDEQDLLGLRCVGGLDLASTEDLTALVLVFYPTHDCPKYRTLCYFFCPEDKINTRKRVDGVDYTQWARDGWINVTPGNVIDVEYLFDFILDLAGKFQIDLLNVDPWNTITLIANLEDAGVPSEKIIQTMKYMGPPTKDLEVKIKKKEISIQAHPIMRWMFGNIVLYIDSNDNYKITKEHKEDKVDGPVAWVMAWKGILEPTEGGDYDGMGPIML